MRCLLIREIINIHGELQSVISGILAELGIFFCFDRPGYHASEKIRKTIF